jgi:hypothetical protein
VSQTVVAPSLAVVVRKARQNKIKNVLLHNA